MAIIFVVAAIICGIATGMVWAWLAFLHDRAIGILDYAPRMSKFRSAVALLVGGLAVFALAVPMVLLWNHVTDVVQAIGTAAWFLAQWLVAWMGCRFIGRRLLANGKIDIWSRWAPKSASEGKLKNPSRS